MNLPTPSRYLLLVCALAVAGCSSTARLPVSEQELQPEQNVTLAGSLSPEVLPQLKKDNAVVIDLRTAAEDAHVEAAQMSGAGITYYNIPIGRSGLPEDATSQLEAALAAHPGQPVVLHCRSGNRAALIWAAHLVDSGQTNEAALAAVDGIINVDGVRTAILDYRSEHPDD